MCFPHKRQQTAEHWPNTHSLPPPPPPCTHSLRDINSSAMTDYIHTTPTHTLPHKTQQTVEHWHYTHSKPPPPPPPRTLSEETQTAQLWQTTSTPHPPTPSQKTQQTAQRWHTSLHLHSYSGERRTHLYGGPPEPPHCHAVCAADGPGLQSAAASPQTTATHTDTATPTFSNSSWASPHKHWG